LTQNNEGDTERLAYMLSRYWTFKQIQGVHTWDAVSSVPGICAATHSVCRPSIQQVQEHNNHGHGRMEGTLISGCSGTLTRRSSDEECYICHFQVGIFAPISKT